MCMNVSPACVFVPCIHAWYPQRPEEATGSPGTRLSEGFTMLVLDAEPGSSAGAASAFHHWAISPILEPWITQLAPVLQATPPSFLPGNPDHLSPPPCWLAIIHRQRRSRDTIEGSSILISKLCTQHERRDPIFPDVASAPTKQGTGYVESTKLRLLHALLRIWNITHGTVCCKPHI